MTLQGDEAIMRLADLVFSKGIVEIHMAAIAILPASVSLPSLLQNRTERIACQASLLHLSVKEKLGPIPFCQLYQKLT